MAVQPLPFHLCTPGLQLAALRPQIQWPDRGPHPLLAAPVGDRLFSGDGGVEGNKRLVHTDAVQGEGVALVGDRRPHLGGIGLEALRRTAEAAGPGDQLQRAGGRRHAAHAQGRRQNTGYRPPAETAGAGLSPSLRQPLQNGVHAPVKALRNWAVLPPGPLF